MLSIDQPLNAKLVDQIQSQQLPDSFLDLVVDYYLPLANRLLANYEGSPQLVGIQGLQGSGKSTCASFLKLILEQCASLRVAVVSLDDFYLSKAQRARLAEQVHPLLATRGVPGTHDLALMQNTLRQFRNGLPLILPEFDKAQDDLVDKSRWRTLEQPVDLLLFEGWCVGLTPQEPEDLIEPVNELESEEDSSQIWRSYVNQQLEAYQSVYQLIDTLVVLQAPDFSCVRDWRLLQEVKLAKKQGEGQSRVMSRAEVMRFIHFFERLSRHALATLAEQADMVLQLNHAHGFDSISFAKS